MPIFTEGGFLRDLLLVLLSGVVFYSIVFASIFLIQWRNDKFRKVIDLKLSWALFLYGLAINQICFIIADYHFTADPLNTLLTRLGYVSMTLALTSFYFAMEMILPYKLRHSFTAIGLTSALLTLLVPRAFFDILALVQAIIALVGIMLFLEYTLRITTGDVRSSVKRVIAGALIGWLGFIGRSDFVFYEMSELLYVVGVSFLIVGILLFGYSITTSPALDELDWRLQLVELYVIRTGGILVYHHHFIESPDTDQALAAAGIEGMQHLFQEITQSEFGLNVVSIGEMELLFAHSHAFTTVLVARQSYHVLFDKVQEFTEKFDLVFGTVLQQFEGSLREFGSAAEFVESVF